MRILMTTDTVGGVWTYTRELVAGLLAADERTSIGLVTLGGSPNADQAAWLQIMRDAYGRRFIVETTTLPLEWQQDNAKAYLYAEPLLRRLAKAFQPDVFHSNQFCFGALPLACPKVVVAHSDVLSWMAAVRGPNAVAAAASPWLDTYRDLVSRGLAGATAVVAPTRAMLHDLQSGFGALPQARVIANGRTVPPQQCERKLQAVTAGRAWDEAKGMAVLEDLHTPVPVLIAGETAHSESSYDTAKLHRHTLLGALSEAETLALFAESSVYLVLSLYEPFGLAAVEAAQCGCAVVARDIPSQREVWGDAAIYFHDAENLRDALRVFADTPEALDEAQRRAAVHARERYGREHMTAAYLDLYRTLLAGEALPGSAKEPSRAA